jgi:hypothetical protein
MAKNQFLVGMSMKSYCKNRGNIVILIINYFAVAELIILNV